MLTYKFDIHCEASVARLEVKFAAGFHIAQTWDQFDEDLLFA